MKMKLIWIAACLMLLTNALPAEAQKFKEQKGFNYKAHQKKNEKSKKWAKRRVRAAKGDLVHVQCTPGQSRRHARRSK
ncbi:MAG: hypothetical protein ACKVOR_05280 [Flavobacteriales bacterium]